MTETSFDEEPKMNPSDKDSSDTRVKYENSTDDECEENQENMEMDLSMKRASSPSPLDLVKGDPGSPASDEVSTSVGKGVSDRKRLAIAMGDADLYHETRAGRSSTDVSSSLFSGSSILSPSSEMNISSPPSKKFKDESNGDLCCPVCNLRFETQHTFTVHIRQHNPTDHSHTCSICGKTLSSASSLDRHMLIHSGERPFKCRICNMAFTTNGNMHRHMRTHGADGGTSLAPETDTLKKVPKSSPSRPSVGLPKPKKLMTSDDGDDSNDSGLLESPGSREMSPSMDRHNPQEAILKNLMSKGFPFPFPQNPVLNPTLGFFDLANFGNFSSKKFPEIAKSLCEKIPRSSSSPYSYDCSKCTMSFPSQASLLLHEATHSPTYCRLCSVDLGSTEKFFSHLIQHQVEGMTEGMGLSSLDNKNSFLSMLNLAKTASGSSLPPLGGSHLTNTLNGSGSNQHNGHHHRSHPAKSTSSVASTSKSTVSDSDSGKHDLADIQSIISVSNSGNHLKASSPSVPSDDDEEEQTTSNGETTREGTQKEGPSENLECNICHMDFKNLNALKRHTRSHVSNGHNYSCHLCSYTSLDKSTLVRHLRTHNGERPFQCTICKYAFTTKANCERHVRKRHKLTNKQEIKQAMRSNPEVNNQIGENNLIHPPLKSAHSMDSSDESDFHSDSVCRSCGNDFKSNRNLLHHLTTSKCNKRPFTCSLCHKGFPTENTCIRHVMTHHPEVDLKVKSVILMNGRIYHPRDPEDMTDDESSPLPPLPPPSSVPNGMGSAKSRPKTHLIKSLMNGSGTGSSPSTNKGNSSLQALAQITGSALKPLNLSKSETDYDGGDEYDENNNDEQPFDLSKSTSSSTKKSSSDMTPDSALDLTKKTTPSKSPLEGLTGLGSFPSLFSENNPDSLRGLNAANAILALQMAAQSGFPGSPNLFPSLVGNASSLFAGSSFLQDFLRTTSSTCSGLPSLSSLSFPTFPSLTMPHHTHPHPMSLPSSSSSPSSPLAAPSSLPPLIFPPASAPPVAASTMVSRPLSRGHHLLGSTHMVAGGERLFSCRFCSAGFTLKSNMERHIKRKHPMHAKPSRASRLSVGSAKSSDNHPMSDMEMSPFDSPVKSLDFMAHSTTLSNSTRAALRDVLNNKFSANRPDEEDDMGDDLNMDDSMDEEDDRLEVTDPEVTA